MWPRDLLAKDFTRARIMTVRVLRLLGRGYHTDTGCEVGLRCDDHEVLWTDGTKQYTGSCQSTESRSLPGAPRGLSGSYIHVADFHKR